MNFQLWRRHGRRLYQRQYYAVFIPTITVLLLGLFVRGVVAQEESQEQQVEHDDNNNNDNNNGAIATMQQCSALSQKDWSVAAMVNENFLKAKPLVHWACFPTPSTTCIDTTSNNNNDSNNNNESRQDNPMSAALSRQIQECCKSIFHVMQMKILVPGKEVHRMMNGGLCWKHKNYCRHQDHPKFFFNFMEQCRQEAAVVPQNLGGTAQDATISWVAYYPDQHLSDDSNEPLKQLVAHITSTPNNEGADTMARRCHQSTPKCQCPTGRRSSSPAAFHCVGTLADVVQDIYAVRYQ